MHGGSVAGPVLPAASSFLPATASVDLEIRPAGYLSDEPGSPFSEEVQSQKNHRVCWTRLTQLCNFQVAVQDLHECMAVRSVRAEITVPFTEETLQEQLRIALLNAEECFDRYIVAETLLFDTILLKMREWCNVAHLYRLGTMRNDSMQLTPDRKAVMALIMNQHGLATR